VIDIIKINEKKNLPNVPTKLNEESKKNVEKEKDTKITDKTTISKDDKNNNLRKN